jgi:tRNA wybutosine-synthesizing protein 2
MRFNHDARLDIGSFCGTSCEGFLETIPEEYQHGRKYANMNYQQDEEKSQSRVVLVVPKQHVKTVKSALERSGQLDRASRITQETKKTSPFHGEEPELRMRIPTTVPYLVEETGLDDTQGMFLPKTNTLEGLGLIQLCQDISISDHTTSKKHVASILQNPLLNTLRKSLDALPDSVLETLQLTTAALVSSFPESYSVYKPMLLLPHNAFAAEPWRRLLASHAIDSKLFRPIWKQVAEAVSATHVAINSPIPLQNNAEPEENILRSPVNLTPIYGNFGPLLTPQTLSKPTPLDFVSALWVSTTQNGICQTWAPLYTMFSRGNIREKTRILHLPTVTAIDEPSAVLDMYAGIGYFAFSYKKSDTKRAQNSIKPVLCFELNPWSVEGLRRGAEMNGWTYRIFQEEDMPVTDSGWGKWRQDILARCSDGLTEDFWIFQMSNEHALPIISKHLAEIIPRIIHVNLGLLPTSRLSWRSAVRLIDRKHGGWIHAHENVGIKDIPTRTEEVETIFETLLQEYDDELQGRRRKAVVKHIERVKMYAPGVMHCVFDIYIVSAVDKS